MKKIDRALSNAAIRSNYGCVSENAENNTQTNCQGFLDNSNLLDDNKALKDALETMIRAAHPAYVQDDLLREKLIKARDIAFKALETNRLNTKERHRSTKNHILDDGQAIPNGWLLMPEKHTLDMMEAFAETWYSKKRCVDDHDMQDAYAALTTAAPKYEGEK